MDCDIRQGDCDISQPIAIFDREARRAVGRGYAAEAGEQGEGAREPRVCDVSGKPDRRTLPVPRASRPHARPCVMPGRALSGGTGAYLLPHQYMEVKREVSLI